MDAMVKIAWFQITQNLINLKWTLEGSMKKEIYQLDRNWQVEKSIIKTASVDAFILCSTIKYFAQVWRFLLTTHYFHIQPTVAFIKMIPKGLTRYPFESSQKSCWKMTAIPKQQFRSKIKFEREKKKARSKCLQWGVIWNLTKWKGLSSMPNPMT